MDNNCTVYNTVDIVSKKWSLLIILEINKGSNNERQYSDIKKSIPGITPKILSERLKELELQKIISKRIDNSKVPINTFYSLTECGLDLMIVIQDLKKWGLKWRLRNPACENTYCNNCDI